MIVADIENFEELLESAELKYHLALLLSLRK